jgi:phenylacetate-CoA ligase
MEDVARLPFTQPADLAARPHDFWCVPPHDIGRIVTLSTSGTTGRPKRIGFTPEDQELIIDFFHHGMTTLVRQSDRVIIFLPGETEGSVGDLLKKALSRFGCEGILFGPIYDYGQAVRTLFALKPSCAVGFFTTGTAKRSIVDRRPQSAVS